MQRVEIHPACDRWMMGDRYGTVTSSRKRNGQWQYRVQLDISGKCGWFPEDLIYRFL